MIDVNKEMINALERSRAKLSEEALALIRKFLESSLHSEGGFVDRAGKQDPYYSVFGYFLAFIFDLQIQIETQKNFIKTWKETHAIDLIHAVSLLQCLILIEAIDLKNRNKKLTEIFSRSAFVQNQVKSKLIKNAKTIHADLLNMIEEYRSEDGGFNHTGKKQSDGNIYATFLVWNLYRDLGLNENENRVILNGISKLRLNDGSYVNINSSNEGITSATSAGLIMQTAIDGNADTDTVRWIKNRFNTHGGCTLAEKIPMADVLNTATALLALKLSGEPMNPYTKKTTEFINLHWDESGGFFGSIADMKADCEYSFYALMALGLI